MPISRPLTKRTVEVGKQLFLITTVLGAQGQIATVLLRQYFVLVKTPLAASKSTVSFARRWSVGPVLVMRCLSLRHTLLATFRLSMLIMTWNAFGLLPSRYYLSILTRQLSGLIIW